METSDYSYKELRNRFQLELRGDVHRLTEEVSLLQLDVSLFASAGDEARAEEFYEKVKATEQRIASCRERTELYRSREAIFHMPQTNWSQLKELANAFEPHRQLWTIVHTFNEKSPEWHEGLFVHLDAEAIDQDVHGWLKTLQKLARQLQDDPPGHVAATTRDRVEAFRPVVPLIHALRNPGLRDRHWKRITQLTGQQVPVVEIECVPTIVITVSNSCILSDRSVTEVCIPTFLSFGSDVGHPGTGHAAC